jgi:polysaccharide export outer membrane protein
MNSHSNLRSKQCVTCRSGSLRACIVLSILCGRIILGMPRTLDAQAEAPARLTNTDSTQLNRPVTSAAQPPQGMQEYTICADDQLDIYVMDVPELSRMYRVSPTGMIAVPLVSKEITAVGLTPGQLAQSIGDQLRSAGMVSHPNVTVQVKESRLHSVTISGAVKKPQIYSIFGKTTLLDAISQAEGLAPEAGNTAIITRGDLGNRMAGTDQAKDAKIGSPLLNNGTVLVDLKRLIEDGDTNLNYELYPGDRVTVQRAGIIYVVGAVNRAGGFVLKDDRQQMTVLKALALAEYLKSTAAAKRTLIIREAPKAAGGTQEIPVELDKIVDGKAKDRVLLANDILFIPESSSKRALNRAGEAAAQAAVVLLYRVP